MSSVTRLCVLLVSIMLVGCTATNSSYIQNRQKAYLYARSIPPLRIPPGIANNSIHNYYPVSERMYPQTTPSLLPPGLVQK